MSGDYYSAPCCCVPPPVFNECPDPCPCTGDLTIDYVLEVHRCLGKTGEDQGCVPGSTCCGSASATVPWRPAGLIDCVWGGGAFDQRLEYECEGGVNEVSWLVTAGCGKSICGEIYDTPRWFAIAPGMHAGGIPSCWLGGGFNCTGTQMVEQNWLNLPPPFNQTSCGGVCWPNGDGPGGATFCLEAVIQHTMTLSL